MTLNTAHFLETLLAFLMVFIYSSKKALMILLLTHPAQRTPP